MKTEEKLMSAIENSKICDWLLSEYDFEFRHGHGKFYHCAPVWVAEVIQNYIHALNQTKEG